MASVLHVNARTTPRIRAELKAAKAQALRASKRFARLVQNHVGTLARDVSARATQAGLDRSVRSLTHHYVSAKRLEFAKQLLGK